MKGLLAQFPWRKKILSYGSDKNCSLHIYLGFFNIGNTGKPQSVFLDGWLISNIYILKSILMSHTSSICIYTRCKYSDSYLLVVVHRCYFYMHLHRSVFRVCFVLHALLYEGMDIFTKIKNNTHHLLEFKGQLY